MTARDARQSLSGNTMKRNGRSIAKVSIISLLCLTGCGALPVGIAPTAKGEGACRPDLEVEWDNGLPYSNYPLGSSEQDRVDQCDRFYREAEKERQEALARALEEQMSPALKESTAGSSIRF